MFEEPYYKEDSCFVADQMGFSGPTPKGPINTIGAKVKGIKVGTSTKKTMHTWTTTKVDTMTEIRDKTEMVIGVTNIGT